MSNLRSLSGTITIDDTAGTVQSGNLFVQAGSASKQFGPTVAAERNALGVHIFDFLDAAGDDLSFSVDGSSIHSGFTLCTAYNPCNGLASSLQFSGGGATFLNSSPYAVPTPEPSSLLRPGTGLAGLAGVARRRFFAHHRQSEPPHHAANRGYTTM